MIYKRTKSNIVAILQAIIAGKVKTLFVMRFFAGRAYDHWLTLSVASSASSTYQWCAFGASSLPRLILCDMV